MVDLSTGRSMYVNGRYQNTVADRRWWITHYKIQVRIYAQIYNIKKKFTSKVLYWAQFTLHITNIRKFS